MYVYVFDKKTDKKLNTYRGVTLVVDAKDKYVLHDIDGNVNYVNKNGVKIVVYGF